MNDDAAERFLAAIRRQPANLARSMRERCGHCWTVLHHSGYCAPGGALVTLSTCPRCDRKDDD